MCEERHAALPRVNSGDRGHRGPLMMGYSCSALLLPWHSRTTPKPGPLRPWLQTPETTATCVSWGSPRWAMQPDREQPDAGPGVELAVQEPPGAA
jgi:hypothetical protein